MYYAELLACCTLSIIYLNYIISGLQIISRHYGIIAAASSYLPLSALSSVHIIYDKCQRSVIGITYCYVQVVARRVGV